MEASGKKCSGLGPVPSTNEAKRDVSHRSKKRTVKVPAELQGEKVNDQRQWKTRHDHHATSLKMWFKDACLYSGVGFSSLARQVWEPGHSGEVPAHGFHVRPVCLLLILEAWGNAVPGSHSSRPDSLGSLGNCGSLKSRMADASLSSMNRNNTKMIPTAHKSLGAMTISVAAIPQ